MPSRGAAVGRHGWGPNGLLTATAASRSGFDFQEFITKARKYERSKGFLLSAFARSDSTTLLPPEFFVFSYFRVFVIVGVRCDSLHRLLNTPTAVSFASSCSLKPYPQSVGASGSDKTAREGSAVLAPPSTHTKVFAAAFAGQVVSRSHPGPGCTACVSIHGMAICPAKSPLVKLYDPLTRQASSRP